MKHKLIRTFSIFLALVLLLGAVPTTMAAGSELDWDDIIDYFSKPSVQISSSESTLYLTGRFVETRLDITHKNAKKYDIDVEVDVDSRNATADEHYFTAYSAGTYTVEVSVTYTPKAGYDYLQTVRDSDTCTIRVYDNEYQVTVTPDTLTLPKGDTYPLSVTVWDGNGWKVDSDAYSVQWSSDDTRYVTVNRNTGVVTAERSGGYADITATVTLNGDTYSGKSRITVGDGEIYCAADGKSASVQDTITLEPELDGNYYDGNVEFHFSRVSGSADIVERSTWQGYDYAVVSSNVPGVVKIKVSAEIDDIDVAQKVVTVSFYDTVTLDATLKNDAKTVSFSSKDVFTRVKYNGETITSRFDSLANYMTTVSRPQDCYIDFSVASNSKGTLTGPTKNLRNISLSRLGEMKFTPAGGVFQADYTVYDADTELPVSQGTLTLRSTLLAGDIIYSTDYETAITLEEEKFEEFWAEATGKSKSSLSYVTFSPSSSDWGTLYTKLNGDKVTERMMFEPNYRVSSRNYDLDAVTYVPYKNKLTSYSDTVDFTAYGLDGTTVEGQVVIYLNSNAGTSITSRGVVFGKANLTKVLQETFLQNRDADLAYVTFYLPEAEEGTLYYNFTSALDKNLVRSDRQYYVDPDKNDKSQYSLDLVAFVPAAGTYGKITLYYKGFDKTGDISYSGALTLTVNQKDASAAFSDVTARSYSWAADSVDFLYYEDIAKGSGGKYNPGSSITRGDFMLMLYRAFLQKDYEDYKVTSNFSDVTKGSTSYSKETYQAVGVAKYLGIAKGSGGKFNPNSPITREEAMTLIYRTMDEIDWTLSYESYARASSFSDYGSVSSYAKDAITELVSHGVILGNNGKITPKSNITRAEMACILHRVLTY